MASFATYNFHKTKYGSELLIDLIRLESLGKYIRRDPIHCLTYFDITLILDGKGTFSIDDFKFPIIRNQIYFTAPGQVRKWEIKEMPRGLVLIFEEEFLCNFFRDVHFVRKLSFFQPVGSASCLLLNDEQSSFFESLLFDIEKEIPSNTDDHSMRALLYRALAWLNHTYQTFTPCCENTVPNTRMFRFLHLVEQNFRQEHAVDFYAGEMCITPGHLNELVKEYYAVTAKKFLQNRLMLEAKRLLQYSDTSINEISWSLNFQDSSYFIRLFRTETGLSPLAFRRKYNS